MALVKYSTEKHRKRREYMREWYAKQPKIKTTCKSCKKSFHKNRLLKTQFCSMTCSAKGKISKSEYTCLHCGKSKVVKASYAKRAKFCSKYCAGAYYTGEKSKAWKGGTSKERELWQGSLDCKKWRKAVFDRDGYTCVMCKRAASNTVRLNADHIKPWSLFPELRTEVDNGRTLCVDCHKETDTWGSRAKLKTRESYCVPKLV